MLNVSGDEREVENCYRSYYVTKPTQSYIANSIVGCIVNFALCFVGSFLNALVIYVFWKTPKLRSRASYFMIMLLSSNDLMVTSIVHPAFVMNAITEIAGRASCVYKTIYHVSTIVLCLISVETCFVMNIERYLAILHPIYHLTHVTKRRCLIVCCVFWLPAFTLTPVAYVLNWKVQITLTVLAAIVVLGTGYIYIAIFCIARKKRRQRKLESRRKAKSPNVMVAEELELSDASDGEAENRISENVDKPSPLSNARSGNILHSHTAEKKPNKTMTFLQEVQLAKIYLLVVFCTFALNFPNALLLALHQDWVDTVNGVVQANIWTATLVIFSSTSNSLIFFWGNITLKKEGWKVCKRLLRR